MHFHTIVPRLSRESRAWLFYICLFLVWDVWGTFILHGKVGHAV